MSEEALFSSPQRLNSLGYIINILKTFVRILRQFIFFIAYILYKQREILSTNYVWLLILGLLVVVAFIALINFRSFKYYVDEHAEEFVVKRGVWSKSKLVVKFSNILQVNITQNVFQKALSLYSVTLDTAGSDKVEVDLYALDGFHATELKKLLLSKINATRVEREVDVSSDLIVSDKGIRESVLKLPAKNILLVSLLSNYRQGIALFFAFLGTVFQNFKDAFETFEISDEDIDTAAVKELALSSLFTFIAIFVLILVAIPFIINIFRYYFKFYNFTIVKNASGTFNMQYGLFKQVNTIFNREKIQLLIFKQNQVLKRLGIGILSLKQLVTDASKEDRSSIEMPGLNMEDRDKVYALAFGDKVFGDMDILKPKINLLISRLIKMILFFGIVSTFVFFADQYTSIFYPFLVILLLSTTVYNYLFYKSYSLAFNADFIIKRYGVWNEKEIIIPIDRVQGIEVSQTFFQVRSRTVSLHISTTAKRISLNFFPEREANKIVNYMLFIVEK